MTTTHLSSLSPSSVQHTCPKPRQIDGENYAAGTRTFEITLSQAQVKNDLFWTIENVRETSREGREIVIPGMNRIVGLRM